LNILIIGNGGRENCLAWKIHGSPFVNKIYAIPGNPGIQKIGSCHESGVSKSSFPEIKDFVLNNNIDFTIVGPEAPLVDGIVDYFKSYGLKIFGPDMNSARIEGSKVFTKNLCARYKIPTADSAVFLKSEYQDSRKYINGRGKDDFPIVLKVDGLAAGKGVIICNEKNEALSVLDEIMLKNLFGASADRIIIEEFIQGYEVSLLNFCDGRKIVPLVPAQDYKKIFDNDEGKNTGGMGSYSPVSFVGENLLKKMLDKIIYPTYEALKNEKITYRGILYGGIIVRDDEPLLLEYNCRFGDPETQVILPRLNEDLPEILISCSEGSLTDKPLSWDESKCVCVVLASGGYPESSSKGDLIEGVEEEFGQNGVLIFHAGTKLENGNIYTNGGRVLNIVSKASEFKKARENIYRRISGIKFNGMQYRKDIALKVEEDSNV
jgi:phosphoribosylamine--glycine ligase